MEYHVVQGNVLDREHNPPGKLVISHIVNDLGIAGAGVALGIVRKWPLVYEQYTKWHGDNGYYDLSYELKKKATWIKHRMSLGETQFVEVEKDIFIANLVGQKGIGPNEFGLQPIRMDSLYECLLRLRKFVVENKIVSVASPMFGSKRSGGDWKEILMMITDIFDDVNIEWFTYEFDERSSKGV